MVLSATPVEKLVIVESIEAAGNVFFVASSRCLQELELATNQKYKYFGSVHLEAETGHMQVSDQEEQFIKNLQFDSEEQERAFQLVEQVFALFTEFMDELLAYARNRVQVPIINQTKDINFISV